MQDTIIKAVGLGPGDPELITLKGLKALQEADYIFFPASKITKESINSFSKKIIDEYDLKAICKPLLFPMKGENIDSYYNDAFNTLVEYSKKGFNVVIVNEGDILFYSTYGYIQEIANENNVKCELIPGIPAFILAGTQMQEPLICGDKSIKVMARPESFTQIEQQYDTCDVLIIMKMKFVKGWFEFLGNWKGTFFYAEKLGTKEEFTTKKAADLENRIIPYFAILILKK